MALVSCALVKSSPDEITNGIYTWKQGEERLRIRLQTDSAGYKIQSIGKGDQQTSAVVRQFQSLPSDIKLIRQSPDLDFVTFPVKYRPASEGVSPQLNSNINGALYLGYRLDRFKTQTQIGYQGSPDHFGISGGLFAGIGNTFISPTTTAGRQQLEYDGVVFIRGLAVILAVKRFTVGLAIGRDRLTDANDRNWIYRNKTWTGIAVGLNIN